MGCFASTVGVILLLGFIDLSAGNKDTCDVYAEVGQNLNLSFVYEGLTNQHGLKWTHNNKEVFSRQQGKVTLGKIDDISPMGSLSLKNLQFSDAGTYQATVLHPNNTIATKWSGRLCVIDKVTKPQLTYVCDFKSSAVNLNCNVTSPQGLVFSWTHDKKKLPSQTRQTLSIPLGRLQGGNFMCSVENKVSKENSNVVRPTCKSPSPSPPTLYCLTFKTFGAVLAAGGALILVLLIIIIILCCRHKRTKTKMKLRNKVELSLPLQEPGSISPDYETMHATEDYPCPSPKPSPRAFYKNGSQLEGQTENRPVQLSTAAEEQKPSPVPKPRTKITQTPNIWMCLCCHLRNFQELIQRTCLWSNNLHCKTT